MQTVEFEPPPAPTVPPGVLGIEETFFDTEGGIEGPGTPAAFPATRAASVEAGAAADRTPFSSSTLAELYLRQGLVQRAVEVYRQLLAEEPDNERARTRLAEITSAPADEHSARRRSLERTIAGLEALLVAVRRRRG
jgi:hypothetical protein